MYKSVLPVFVTDHLDKYWRLSSVILEAPTYGGLPMTISKPLFKLYTGMVVQSKFNEFPQKRLKVKSSVSSPF